MSLEDTLATWARPPGETEQAKAENAERAIRDAIGADPVLSKYNLRVFAQGSYRANTTSRGRRGRQSRLKATLIQHTSTSHLSGAELLSPGGIFWWFCLREARKLYWKADKPFAGAVAFWEDTMRYLYLPRLKSRAVLEQAIVKGAATRDFFGTASGSMTALTCWLSFGPAEA